MGEAFERIKAGLEEAIAFARGEDAGAIVHHIDVPAVDVATIRASTGLSQDAFAKSIGVAKPTLLNWEQGRFPYITSFQYRPHRRNQYDEGPQLSSA